MSEKLDHTAIRNALVECAEELNALQNSNTMSYIEVDQRHGRADGKRVDLYDRNGAPVMEETQDKYGVVFRSFVGKLGGVCLGCPVLAAGDGCALRESFHQITADMRARSEAIAYQEPMRAIPSTATRKPKAKQPKVPKEVKTLFLPEDQLAANEDPEVREQRLQQIAEIDSARRDAIAGIYSARRRSYAYPGAATRLKERRNELNEDHTDHISQDD